MTTLTEIEKIRLENLKKFPESILRIERRTVAICDRCLSEIELHNSCLTEDVRYDGGRVELYHQKRCPHCNITGGVEVISSEQHKIEFGVALSGRARYSAVKHTLRHITEYIVKETRIKNGWFGSKTLIDSVIEYTERPG